MYLLRRRFMLMLLMLMLMLLMLSIVLPLFSASPPSAHGQTSQHSIGRSAFRRVWQRQDAPIADDLAGTIAPEHEPNRSWTWGPHPITPVLREPMQQSPGGQRDVQYFDKSRMEINDPNANPDDMWYVTNGLLPIEMMQGRIQVSFDSFEEHSPAALSAIGDPDTFPRYADLADLYASPGTVSTDALNKPVTTLYQPDGSFATFDDYADHPATVLVEGGNGHGMPQGFLDFQESYGVIYDENGNPTRDQVYEPSFVFGHPVTPAYWVTSLVANKETMILFQVFERRVLTYNPTNPPAFRVEMGNVGQHYYQWRYGELGKTPVKAPAEPGGGGDTPPPPSTQSGEMTLFGMNTYITGQERIKQDGADGTAELTRLGREAGGEWAREELSWANIETTKKGEYHWKHYDTHIKMLADAGYNIMGIVLTTPGWARVGDCKSREGVTEEYWCPPGNAQDFGDFMGAIVERYDGDGNADAPGSPRVDAWQIWNEPSTRQTWPGSPTEYGNILAKGYAAAKAANPNAIVATGGVYLYDGMGTDPSDGLPFLNEAIAAVPAAAQSFDVLAIHPYMPTAAPDEPVIFSPISMWGRITTAQQWLSENASGRPLWISEVGWSTCEPSESGCNPDVSKSEDQQANYLVRTYAIALAKGVQHVNYFQLEDKFDGGTGRLWAKASVLDTKGTDYRKKLAYTAYRVMAEQLSGATFDGYGEHNTFTYEHNVQNPQDLYHLRFAKDNGEVVEVLWHNTAPQRVMLSPRSGYTAQVITRDGAATPLTAATEQLVGEQPLYVHYTP
jgi:hypothetical protein